MYFKKVTAAVLAALMCSTSISYEGLWKRQVQETKEKELVVNSAENIKMEATNSLGSYITQVTQKQESEQQKMFNNAIAKDEFTIVAMNFDVATGVVAVKTTQAAECTLRIRFINDEDGKEFVKLETKLQRGKETIFKSELDVNSLPEYFQIEASIVGPMNESLCAPFVYKEYTREIQEIKATKIEDFEQEYVVNLDEKENTNFVVLAENTKVAASTATSNLLVSADYDNNVFVFENPDKSITELKKGDQFFSQPDEANFIAVIVDSIEIAENQAIIYGSSESIDDLFSFVKIEIEGEKFDWEGTPENVSFGNSPQELTASGIATECTASETTAAAESTEVSPSQTDTSSTADSTAAPTEESTGIVPAASSESAATETDVAPAESVDPISEAAVQTSEAQEISAPGIGNYQLYEGVPAANAEISGGIDLDLGDTSLSASYKKSGDLTSLEMELIIKEMFKIGLQMEDTFEFYKDWDYTYSCMQLVVTATVGVEFSTDSDVAKDYINKLFKRDAKEGWGKIDFLEIPIPTPIAGLSFSFVPSVFVEIEGELSFTFNVTGVIGFVYDSETKDKLSTIFCGPTIDPKITLKGEVQAGLALTLRANVVNKRFFSVYVTGKFGSYATGETNIEIGHPDMETDSVVIYDSGAAKVHACTVCLKGEVGTIFGLEVGLEFLGAELSANPLTMKWKWGDYYFCGNEFEFGFGECPHYSYKTTIQVQDPDGNPMGGTVEVKGSDGATATLPVDTCGTAIFYCKQGKFNYWVYDDNKTIESGNFHVGPGSKYVYAVVGDDVSNNTETTKATTKETTTTTSEVTTATTNEEQGNMACIESGRLGEHVFYSLHRDGLLRIWGDGDMYVNETADDKVKNGQIGNRDKIKRVVIENNSVDKVTSISGYMLNGCPNLVSVEMPDTIKKIHARAFYDCEKLEKITISSDLEYIGRYTFGSCPNLKEFQVRGTSTEIGKLVLPNKVKTIGEWAFSDCTAITEVVLPESLENIYRYAFQSCDSLTKAVITSEKVTMGEGIFQSTNLKEVTLPFAGSSAESVANNEYTSVAGMLFYNGVPDEFRKITITGGVRIPQRAFRGLPNVTEINLPDTITEIQDYAFDGCTNLESINIPDEVTYIGNSAFHNCSKLPEVIIPDKVKTIGEWAFGGCTLITEVVLPEGLETLGKYAFQSCDSLTKAVITSEKVTMGTGIFQSTNLKEVTLPFAGSSAESVANSEYTSVAGMLFYNGVPDEFRKITITGGVRIPQRAFRGLPNVTEINLPDTITVVHDNAFQYCNSVERILFRGNAPEFSDAAFNGVTTTVYYPKNDSTWTADKLQNYGGTITWVGIDLPTITQQPKSVYVKNGTEAKVVCNATGEELTYQWYYKDKGTYQYEAASGSNTNTYTVTMNEACDGRQVYCVVTDKYGDSVQTEVATLYMRTPLKLVAQTVNAAVYEGAKAIISVEAIGDGLTYDWYYMNRGGIEFAHTSSFQTNTYAVEMSDRRDGRQIYCVVSDKYGNSVQTDTVTIQIKRCAEIISQPQDVYALNGRTANVTFDAVGDDLTYEWYVMNKGELDFSDTSVCKSSVYSVKMDSNCDGRKVYCVITDKYGNCVRTEIAKLVMGNPKDNPYELLTEKGKNAEIKLNTIGDNLKYKWYYKDKGADGFSHAEVFTTDSYSVTMDEKVDGRQVYCVTIDKHGNRIISNVYTLTMIKPITITKQPKNTVAENGTPVAITVEATGDDLIYKWYYCDADSTVYKLSGVTTNQYSATMTDAKNGRRIYCDVIDRYGNSVRTNIVTLSMQHPLKIVEQPQNICVKDGEQAIIILNVTGDGLTYKWYYKNKSQTRFYETTAFTSNTYEVTMNAARDGRKVYCVITDKYGNSVRTNTVTLSMQHPLKIVEQPQNICVKDGEQAKIILNVTGDGLTYKWYFMNAGDADYSYTSTFTGNMYSIKMNEVRDGRKVYCVITDKYGNSVRTYAVTLSMQHSVKLVEQPKSICVKDGEQAKIILNVTGDALTYKWYFKNAGETKFMYTSTFSGKIYSIRMNEIRDGREVYCVITDEYGNSVRTNTVTLSMQHPVQLVEQPQNIVAPNGENASVTLNVTGDGLTYKWYYKNKSQTKFYETTAFTSNTYEVAMSSARDGRQIYCEITDKYGNTVQTDVITMYMGNPITIIEQPKNASAAEGATVKTQLNATGDGLIYQWYYCNADSETFKLSSIQTNVYSAKMTAAKNGRKVYCEITDQYGVKVKTDVVTLEMQ